VISFRYFFFMFIFFFSSRRRHTRFSRDWSSDVCSSDLSCLPESGRQALEVLELLGAHCVGVLLSQPRARLQPCFNACKAGRQDRSEERRVGKEWRSRGWTDIDKKRNADSVEMQ